MSKPELLTRGPQPVPRKDSDQVQVLAMKIAVILGEPKAVEDFKQVCRVYNHDFIRHTLVEVDHVPQEKIKKTKRALFFYLIKHNAKETR